MIRQQLLNLTTGFHAFSQFSTYRAIAYATAAMAACVALSYLMQLIIKGACYWFYYLLIF